MTYSHLSFILCLTLALCLLSCVQPEPPPSATVEPANPGSLLFRHENPNFRFVFPDSWEPGVPAGEDVRALVVDKLSPASCNIVVRRYSRSSVDIASEVLAQIDVDDIIPRTKFPDATLVNERTTAIDNQPARLVTYDLSYSTVQGTFAVRRVVVLTARHPHLYSASCVTGIDQFADEYSTFERIIGSIVFEEWKDS